MAHNPDKQLTARQDPHHTARLCLTAVQFQSCRYNSASAHQFGFTKK